MLNNSVKFLLKDKHRNDPKNEPTRNRHYIQHFNSN